MLKIIGLIVIQAVRQVIAGGWGYVDAGKVIQPSVTEELQPVLFSAALNLHTPLSFLFVFYAPEVDHQKAPTCFLAHIHKQWVKGYCVARLTVAV